MATGVTPRTLENQWKALGGGAEEMRLQDLLWLIRLLEALELRGSGVPLRTICEALEVDLRSLQRACRRHLGESLGRVSAGEAPVELLRLRQRLLKRLEPLRRRQSGPAHLGLVACRRREPRRSGCRAPA